MKLIEILHDSYGQNWLGYAGIFVYCSVPLVAHAQQLLQKL